MRLDLRHPGLVLVGVALAVAVRLLGTPPVVKGVVLGAFLLVVPGAALVGRVRWPALAWWTVVLSASAALSVLASLALLYAGIWSADGVLVVLAGGSALGCLLHLLRPWAPQDGA